VITCNSASLTCRLADERLVLLAYMRSSASFSAWLSVAASDGIQAAPCEQPMCQPSPLSCSAALVRRAGCSAASGPAAGEHAELVAPIR